MQTHVAKCVVGLKRAALLVAFATFIMTFFVPNVAAADYVWSESTGAGANTWQAVASSADGSKLALAVYGGSVWTSDDYGQTWTERTDMGVNSWRYIASSADGTKLAVGAWLGSNIWTSSDSGQTWTERTGAGSHSWSSIASSADGNTLVAVDTGGTVWYSSDAGASWADYGSSYGVRKLVLSADGSKWAGITASGVATYDVGTASWLTHTITPGLHTWQSIASNSSGDRLVVGDNGGSLWSSNDFGQTWTELTGAGSGKWQAVASSADGSVLVAGDVGSNDMKVSTDFGQTWTVAPISGSHKWYYFAVSSDGERIAAVDDGVAIWLGSIPSPPVPPVTTDPSTPVTESSVSPAESTTEYPKPPNTGLPKSSSIGFLIILMSMGGAMIAVGGAHLARLRFH